MPALKTIGDALRLAQSKIDRLDAQYLLAHLLGTTRAYLIAHTERAITTEQILTFELQITARERGVPVAQIIGAREFYGREFVVNEHVLIPRPETEFLITQALAVVFSQKHVKVPVNKQPSILDLGTGSGAIAITLALEIPDAMVTAVDRSPDALAVTKQNAARLLPNNSARIRFLESNWYSALPNDTFDLIVANPPYISSNDRHLLKGDLRFEPRMALTDDSDDGLASIRAIIVGATSHLHEDGWLMFEHGFDQAERCAAMLNQAGFIDVASINDLAGIPRIAVARCCTPYTPSPPH